MVHDDDLLGMMESSDRDTVTLISDTVTLISDTVTVIVLIKVVT